MTVYVRVTNVATVEIDDEELDKAGMTLEDLYGYPVRNPEEAGVDYQLEVDSYHWESGAGYRAVYRHPPREGDPS